MLQNQALDILKMGANVFLTGPAGSGKTYVLNQYVDYLRSRGMRVGVAAATGIAATHIGGTTIHSWSGLGVRDQLTDQDLVKLLKKRYLRKHFLNTQTLIIDEISMLHARQLDMLNQLAQAFRQDLRPFGGLQIVMSGDFFQLPPINQNGQPAQLVTQSEIWQQMDLRVCYLHEQFRQADKQFLQILNEIRANNISTNSHQLLLSRLKQSFTGYISPAKLYTHNIDVDLINLQELNKINKSAKQYSMQTSGHHSLVETIQKSCLAPDKLMVKIGAKVMFVKNNFELGVVNGTLGRIVDFDSKSFPLVQIKSGEIIPAHPAEWTIQEDERVLAEIKQIPLRLAWAITVHKSQGLSLDAAEIDLSKSFVPGMGYVALSRVRALDGLVLKGFNKLALEVDSSVLELDQDLQAQSNQTIKYLDSLSAAEKLGKQQKFMGENLNPLQAKRKTKQIPGRIITQRLLKQQLSIQQIARQQRLKPATILKHIEELVKQGKPVELKHLLPAKPDMQKIIQAIHTCGFERLSPIYEFLQEKYAYDTLRLARAWCMQDKQITHIPKAYSVDEIRSKHANAYQPWTQEDDKKLEILFNQGKSIRELCQIFGRHPGAIQSRIEKLENKELDDVVFF